MPVNLTHTLQQRIRKKVFGELQSITPLHQDHVQKFPQRNSKTYHMKRTINVCWLNFKYLLMQMTPNLSLNLKTTSLRLNEV